jgi:hypothetical protein
VRIKGVGASYRKHPINFLSTVVFVQRGSLFQTVVIVQERGRDSHIISASNQCAAHSPAHIWPETRRHRAACGLISKKNEGAYRTGQLAAHCAGRK